MKKDSLDLLDSLSPRSLQTADCTPITTVRCSALCGSNRVPCVFSHMSDPFLGWPASRSWIWEIFSVGFGDIAFRGASSDVAKPSQPFLLYHFSDCVFHLKGFADVLVSQPFSARNSEDGS